jgi:alpha-mannosidase
LRPMSDRWEWTEIGFSAASVPGLGYRTYRLARRGQSLDARQLYFTAVQPTALLKGSQAVTDLAIGENTLENSRLRVEVDATTGTLTVVDKTTREVYSGLNAFEDGGDAGDSYNYSEPLNDLVLRSDRGARVHVSVAEAGYARATLRIDLDWALPVGLTADRLSRSAEYIVTRISTLITLVAGEPRVEIVTEWENHSRDHRLRALFPLGAHTALAHAQEHFYVTTRPASVAEKGRGWPEPTATTWPQQGWVSIDDERRGLTVANRGLPEYEVLGDDTIALTLLRAVGWLSREDLLSRVGGAGPTIPTPDAQSPGCNRVSYAIIPHRGNWLTSNAYRIAEEYLTPLYGSSTGAHPGDQPYMAGGVSLQGNHTLLLSACKKAEVGDALILRFWNAGDEPTEARVTLGQRPGMVWLVNLREEPISDEALAVDASGSFMLRAGPAQIVTVAASFEGNGA